MLRSGPTPEGAQKICIRKIDLKDGDTARNRHDMCQVYLSSRLERFPIRWNHLIGKESLKIKDLEHVMIEKADQFFQNML